MQGTAFAAIAFASCDVRSRGSPSGPNMCLWCWDDVRNMNILHGGPRNSNAFSASRSPCRRRDNQPTRVVMSSSIPADLMSYFAPSKPILARKQQGRKQGGQPSHVGRLDRMGSPGEDHGTMGNHWDSNAQKNHRTLMLGKQMAILARLP